MPYYRFYVELPEEKRAGLNNYGAYYVPAVEKEYLTNMPVFTKASSTSFWLYEFQWYINIFINLFLAIFYMLCYHYTVIYEKIYIFV